MILDLRFSLHQKTWATLIGRQKRFSLTGVPSVLGFFFFLVLHFASIDSISTCFHLDFLLVHVCFRVHAQEVLCTTDATDLFPYDAAFVFPWTFAAHVPTLSHHDIHVQTQWSCGVNGQYWFFSAAFRYQSFTCLSSSAHGWSHKLNAWKGTWIFERSLQKHRMT